MTISATPGWGANTNEALSILVPVVHSSRRGVNADLAAALAMAVAYARGDADGDSYRDLLENVMGERAVTFQSGVHIAHRLFPDIPMPTYDAHDLHIGDVLTLVRLAVERRGHLVPVFAVNLERGEGDRRHRETSAITLRELDSAVGTYWDPGAPLGHEGIAPDELSLAAAFHECAIIGTLPPAR